MYFDSPFEFCPVCKQEVVLDQTQAECAAEHDCEGIECPLARYFSGKEFHESDARSSEKAGEKD